MSGHNKWSKIKRDKAITDAKRSQNFSKLSRLITVAAKQGGGDPDSNPVLRLAIDKAKEASMPKDNIEKAINKALGIGGDGASYEEVVYEGYGPSGVAFLVKAVTDNRNRTVSEVRNIFSKSGGSLGSSGSTSYIFSSDPENPSFEIEVTQEEGSKLDDLYEALDDHDDVVDVFSNHKVV